MYAKSCEKHQCHFEVEERRKQVLVTEVLKSQLENQRRVIERLNIKILQVQKAELRSLNESKVLINKNHELSEEN